MIEYRGYVAAVEFDDSVGRLHGRIVNSGAYPIATFEATDVDGIRREFERSIDEYLASCREDDVEPKMPLSVTLDLRLGPELHQRAAPSTTAHGVSLNSRIKQAAAAGGGEEEEGVASREPGGTRPPSCSHRATRSTTYPSDVRRSAAMEKQVTNPKPFLEPVYLNEKMVLNCAAYIFKGYSLESEVNDTTETERSFGGKAGFNFLKKLISLNLEAGSKQSSTTENRSARRYTVGGLHMSLIDELHNRKMLHAIGPESLGEDLDSISYVETLAELRPVDFYALIDTLQMAIPIAEKVLTSIVKPLYDQHLELQISNPGLPSKRKGGRSNATPRRQVEQQELNQVQLALGEAGNYASAIQELLKHLEKDYRRSKQIEMVMWSVGRSQRAYGVVDLDLADYEPEELRAKLAGGTYHVIGKVTRNVRKEQSIYLLQKSVLFSAMSLLNRVVEVLGDTDGLKEYHQMLLVARQKLEQFGLLEVAGPALRVAAMSVCI